MNAAYFAQRRAKLTAQGLCTRCRKNLEPNRKGKCLCRTCQDKQNKRRQITTGSQPWTKGSRGRPPGD